MTKKNRMRYKLLAAALLFYCLFPGAAQAAYWVVNVDGWDITMPELQIYMGEPYVPDRQDNILPNELVIANSSLYMPVRKAADIFHLQVDYANGEIKITNAAKGLILPLNAKEMYLLANGGKISSLETKTPAFIRNGQAYVALRTITEVFGGNVEYIPHVKTVNITTSEPLQIAGKRLCYATFYNSFSMQSQLYGYYGYANVAELYRILQDGKRAEIEEPYWDNCDWEIQFYEEKPVYTVGDLRNASGYFLKYNLYTLFGAEKDSFVLYDENEDKWYEYAYNPLDFNTLFKTKVLLTRGGA